MKEVLSLNIVTLLIILAATTPSGGQDQATDAVIRDKFVGAWRLVWLEEPDAAGKI